MFGETALTRTSANDPQARQAGCYGAKEGGTVSWGGSSLTSPPVASGRRWCVALACILLALGLAAPAHARYPPEPGTIEIDYLPHPHGQPSLALYANEPMTIEVVGIVVGPWCNADCTAATMTLWQACTRVVATTATASATWEQQCLYVPMVNNPSPARGAG